MTATPQFVAPAKLPPVDKDKRDVYHPPDWETNLAKPEVAVEASILVWQYTGD